MRSLEWGIFPRAARRSLGRNGPECYGSQGEERRERVPLWSAANHGWQTRLRKNRRCRVQAPWFPKWDAISSAICRRTGFPLAMYFWWILAAAWAALNAWAYRQLMNPDGISYLDMAVEALKHGPLALVNAHWGALYPALIAIAHLVVRPSPADGFAYVHGLNATIHFAAAVAFGFFLRELILFRSAAHGPLWRQSAFIAFGFALFCRYTNGDILPYAVTPDLLLAATAFLEGALFFRIVRLPDKRAAYIAFGVASAAGFYTKSIMLPAGIILLGCVFVCLPRRRANLQNLAIAAALMLLLCAPQIAIISSRVGHLSVGETGRLNYLWWVQGIRQFQGWTGGEGEGTAIHPPRVIVSEPEVLEFASPVGGSYPLWYDPAYWYAGATVHFDPAKQWQVFRTNLKFYSDFFVELRYPLGGLGALLILAFYRRVRPSGVVCCFLLWPLALLAMYGLLLVELRYAAPWLALFWVAAYSAVIARNSLAERALFVALAVAMLAPRLLELKAHFPGLTQPHPPSWDMLVAQRLEEIGVKPGDPIAVLGEGFTHHYAHLARVRIVAQVTREHDYWAISAWRAAMVESALARTGALVLVSQRRPAMLESYRWREIPGTPYSILTLPVEKPSG